MYELEPIGASGVTIPQDLESLTELLAKNAHDIWAHQRLEDGWSYGPLRDDHAKKHACLMPYESLSESEKQYDRRIASGTVRAILALGYRIERA
jgi:hypothetical protein